MRGRRPNGGDLRPSAAPCGGGQRGPTARRGLHSAGLRGALWARVLDDLVITVQVVIWVMIGFFETLPPELDEAAIIDGCSRWRSFRHIALPLSRPGIVVSIILSVIFSWNNFVF